ncbi:MAG: exopolysaccharide biosynthesis protein [Bacteroidetes bacterium]|nr:MAG: exopolysaccharide biosynthesis protein [Bacteroidota bacterium]
MEQKDNNRNVFESANLFEFFWHWRKPLIVIGLATAIGSSAVALIIREKFKSTVIMFPAASNSLSKDLIAEDLTGKRDVLMFGEEEQAEQMLQILNADEIRTRICDKYDLVKHYRIDPNDKYKRTLLYETFMENVSFKRTEFMSVKIEVMDEDPKMAADIANDIAALLDSAKTRMQRERARQAFRIVENEYSRRRTEVQVLTDSMGRLNELGMYDYESQSEVTSEQYAIALSKGDQRAIQSLGDQLKVISKYGSAYMAIRENLYIQREQLNLLKKKYDEAKLDVEESLTYKFVVNRAFPAEKKSYPVRWLIVVVSTLSALIMGVLGIILFDNIRRVRGRQQENQKKNDTEEKAEPA